MLRQLLDRARRYGIDHTKARTRGGGIDPDVAGHADRCHEGENSRAEHASGFAPYGARVAAQPALRIRSRQPRKCLPQASPRHDLSQRPNERRQGELEVGGRTHLQTEPAVLVLQPAKLLGIVGLHAPVLVAPAPKAVFTDAEFLGHLAYQLSLAVRISEQTGRAFRTKWATRFGANGPPL